MGNICSGSKEEGNKSNAFVKTSASDGNGNGRGGGGGTHEESTSRGNHHHDNHNNNNSNNHNETSSGGHGGGTAVEPSLEEKKQLESYRLEQARLDMIVQQANRKMVAVRSTRGSNAYYDQGFAAALSQHLEQTTHFRQDSVGLPLPPAVASTTATGKSGGGVYERLAQPAWQGIQVGFKDSGIAGLAGESPHAFMDRVAESLLEEVVPRKERLFANVEPMVESLL